VLQDAVLVSFGMNYVAEVSSPKGTTATIVRVSAVAAGVRFSDQFADKLSPHLATDYPDAYGVQIVPGFVVVVHFAFGLKRPVDNAELAFAVLQIYDVIFPVNNLRFHGVVLLSLLVSTSMV
jgi:hypothetical protein